MSLNLITLNVKVTIGADIRDVCCDICELASRIECRIECNFNDVLLLANPRDDGEELVVAYRHELNTNNITKIASCCF